MQVKHAFCDLHFSFRFTSLSLSFTFALIPPLLRVFVHQQHLARYDDDEALSSGPLCRNRYLDNNGNNSRVTRKYFTGQVFCEKSICSMITCVFIVHVCFRKEDQV